MSRKKNICSVSYSFLISVRLQGNLYISEMSDPLGWKQLPGAIPTVDMTYNKSSSLSVYVNKLSGRRTSSDYTMT